MGDMQLIMDPSKRFYAGMTLMQAKMDGTDKSFWRRDFHNLDKDRNGVLSVNEVMNERNRVSRNNKIAAAICPALAALDIIANTDSKLGLAFDLGLTALLMYSGISSAVKIDKETKEYEKNIKSNNINRYA